MNSLEKRFWKKVQKGDGCWIWVGALAKGYGRIQVKTPSGWRLQYAHRLAWEFDHGPVPDGLEVCHHCDNPACVRGDHLFIGTLMDNHRDATEKGRYPRGINHWQKKLTEDDVLQIRSMTDTHQKIAEHFNICNQMVSLIKRRISWSHI